MNNLFQAFAKVADGALIINQDQEIVYWNRAAEDILGYTRNEVTGRFCYQILKGRDSQSQLICQKHCRVAMVALDGGTVMNYDSRLRTKSGDVRWINISTFTLPTNGTQAASVLVHLFRDVTQKKQNEQFIDQILAAAKHLANRELPETVPSKLIKQPRTDLTDREVEVLNLLAEGRSTNGIARSLSISPATTRNHIRNILQKFQVHSRLEAVVYALEQGLIAKDY